MQQFKNETHPENLDENSKYFPLSIDVSKPFEHKQIDTRWIQLKLNGKFIPRSYFASCIQAGKVFIHGGYNEEKGILNDFVTAQFYDLPSEWTEMKQSNSNQKNPPPLRNHTLCPFISNLIMFGGQKNMLENNNLFYKFDFRTNQWSTLQTKFENDKKLNLFLDSHIAKIYNNKMYIFGGYESELGLYSDVLYEAILDNINSNEILVRQVQIKSQRRPKSRGSLSGCVVRNELYIFGGTNSDVIFDDMWTFNFQTQQWSQISVLSKTQQWPQRRKGHIMVCHQKSKSIFMFGGIRQITKEQNQIMVFNISKKKWIKIHKSTNELYEPSPTIKKQEQSPSIIEAKNKKNVKIKDQNKKSPFKLNLKSVTVYGQLNTQSHDIKAKNDKAIYTQYGIGFAANRNANSKKYMSLVQQKKLREFMNRKKKLLSEVNKASIHSIDKKRNYSPTSETIIYSLDTIGQQKKYQQNFQEQLPKVIFDEQKGALIGKKPCARDGHAGLVYQQTIIIIGGDRHMMSFNDVYLFKMDKALMNIHLYQ